MSNAKTEKVSEREATLRARLDKLRAERVVPEPGNRHCVLPFDKCPCYYCTMKALRELMVDKWAKEKA